MPGAGRRWPAACTPSPRATLSSSARCSPALGENGDPAAAVTPRVRDVVRWRLARLPDGTADVLAAAAVAGAEFDADVLADAVDIELEPRS